MRTEQQYNLPEQKAFRKELRNSMTSAEVVLWQMLKGKQIEGFKFRRQFGIGPFVVDFYCPILRLAIELDGAYHFSEEMESYDEQRSLYLARNDIKVLRFENRIVFEEPWRILDASPLRGAPLRQGSFQIAFRWYL